MCIYLLYIGHKASSMNTNINKLAPRRCWSSTKQNEHVAVLRLMPANKSVHIAAGMRHHPMFCFPARYSFAYQTGSLELLFVSRGDSFSTISCLVTQCQSGEEGDPYEWELLSQWLERKQKVKGHFLPRYIFPMFVQVCNRKNVSCVQMSWWHIDLNQVG